MSNPNIDPSLGDINEAQEVMGLYPNLSVQRDELAHLMILEGVGGSVRDLPERRIDVFPSWRGDDRGPDLSVWVFERQPSAEVTAPSGLARWVSQLRNKPDPEQRPAPRQGDKLELLSKLRISVSDGDYSLITVEGDEVADKAELLGTINEGVDLFLAYLSLSAATRKLVWPSKVYDKIRSLSDLDFASALAGSQIDWSSVLWCNTLSPAESLIFAKTTLDQAKV